MDIEVNRYALRTFMCADGHLKSLFRSDNWDGGAVVARCIRGGTLTTGGVTAVFGLDSRRDPNHRPPADNCGCGLYGTLTLDQLLKEYPEWAHRCVAVFAAEGETVIGPRGLRTAAARIVAYWAGTRTEKEVFEKQAPEARWFKQIEPMLKDYGFPKYDPACALQPLHPYKDEPRPANYMVKTPIPRPRKPPPPKVLAVSWGSSWNNLAPMMSAATPAGVQAVQQVTGYNTIPGNGRLLPLEAPKGTVVCTSGRRPHNPPIGQVVYELDTSKLMVYSKPDRHPAAWRDFSGKS